MFERDRRGCGEALAVDREAEWSVIQPDRLVDRDLGSPGVHDERTNMASAPSRSFCYLTTDSLPKSQSLGRPWAQPIPPPSRLPRRAVAQQAVNPGDLRLELVRRNAAPVGGVSVVHLGLDDYEIVADELRR
jgi:hypothetical protein